MDLAGAREGAGGYWPVACEGSPRISSVPSPSGPRRPNPTPSAAIHTSIGAAHEHRF